MNTLTLNSDHVYTPKSLAARFVTFAKVMSVTIFFAMFAMLAGTTMMLYADNTQMSADLESQRITIVKLTNENRELEKALAYEKSNGCIARAVNSVENGIAAIGNGIASAAGYVAGVASSAIDHVKE